MTRREALVAPHAVAADWTEAVLDLVVSPEVGEIGLRVRDVIAIATWLEPLVRQQRERARSDEAVALWRCSACGKWSHAKRKPKRHKVAILSDHEYGTDVSGYRPCGPFDEYTAMRVAAAPVTGEANDPA